MGYMENKGVKEVKNRGRMMISFPEPGRSRGRSIKGGRG